jgi:2'-5' RNA ligase
LRAFVALDIPDRTVVDSLVSVQGELSATGADLRPVERENIHFTLKFLGEVSEPMAHEAADRLGKISLRRETVKLVGLGAFPGLSRPSVIWVGVANDDRSKVDSIAEAVLSSLRDIGERDDRPFQAHATLARVRSGRNHGELVSFLSTNSAREFGTVTLTAFSLKSSKLTPAGPIYEDVGVYPLA